ncbi:MAG: hypothetical protein M3Y82_13280, partial [Verrucomicrobiota bacterium]|nr:hypothetical protein [Verrucomicrobiota bacterium]
LTLYGEAPQEFSSRLTDYNEAMGKVIVNGDYLKVDPPTSSPPRANPAGVPTVSWSFACRLGKEERR